MLQKEIHARRIAIRHDKKESITGQWLYCSVDIAIFSDMVTRHAGTYPSLTPAVFGLVYSSKSSLIMEHQAGFEETLTYCDFPSEHWTKIRTNNVIERMNREIRRRTRVVGAFPDGNSALMLVCARLRHVAGTQWGSKKYMSMKHLEAMEQELLVG